MLPEGLRVFVCTGPVEMRRSFDSLSAVVREYLGEDPLSGHLFVFFSRNWSSVKVLYWEQSGYWIILTFTITTRSYKFADLFCDMC